MPRYAKQFTRFRREFWIKLAMLKNPNGVLLTMLQKTAPHIYDIYILNTAGLPLFGGCTGSTFCQENIEQHALHCGFFAAITSFCEEAFAQRKLRLIEMENLKVHMLADPSAKVIIAGVYPVEMVNKASRKQLEVIINRFTKKYSGILPANIVNDIFFEDFTEDLLELKIIPSPNIRPSLACNLSGARRT